jgi:hypothetical protein
MLMPPLDRAEFRMVPGLLLEVAGGAWRMRREIAVFVRIAAHLAWLQLQDEIEERRRKPEPCPSAMPVTVLEPWPTVELDMWKPTYGERGRA